MKVYYDKRMKCLVIEGQGNYFAGSLRYSFDGELIQIGELNVSYYEVAFPYEELQDKDGKLVGGKDKVIKYLKKEFNKGVRLYV